MAEHNQNEHLLAFQIAEEECYAALERIMLCIVKVATACRWNFEELHECNQTPQKTTPKMMQWQKKEFGRAQSK